MLHSYTGKCLLAHLSSFMLFYWSLSAVRLQNISSQTTAQASLCDPLNIQYDYCFVLKTSPLKVPGPIPAWLFTKYISATRLTYNNNKMADLLFCFIEHVILNNISETTGSNSMKLHGYVLKRISNWPLYKIWYYATYLINAFKVWLFCFVHTNLSINGKKTCFHKTTMRNDRYENRLCARAPRARLASCRIW